MKQTILICNLIFLVGCSTVFESTDPYTTTPYLDSKNTQGETIYTRREYRDPMMYSTAPDYYNQSIQEEESSETKSTTMTLPPKLPLPIEAPKASEPGMGFGFGFEYAAGDGNHHVGVNFNGATGEWLQARGGVSFFVSKDTYAGFDLALRAVPLKKELKPFAGIGAYIGDTKTCKVSTFDVDVCEKKFLSAGYGEIGISYRNWSLFYRDYNITRAGLDVPTDYFIGIGIDSSW